MSVIWQKVWSDIWDNKTRTILVVLSISVGVFAVGAIFGMSDQLLVGMDTAHQATIPAHFTMSVTRNINSDIANRLEKIEGVDGDIALGNFSAIQYKIDLEDPWDTAWLVMREDYENQDYELLLLKDGAWPEGNRVGIERLSSQYFNLEIGDTVYFEVDDRPKARKINGKLRHNFVPPPDFGGPAVFFTDAEGMELFDVPKGEYNQLLVRVAPYSPELAREVASEIKDRLSKEDIGVAVTIYQDPEKHWGRDIMAGINLVLQVMAVVSLGASVVLVFNTLTGIITQQTDQIGILKAIGGTQGKIVRIYLVAVLVYGLLSLLIALPLGMVLAFGITQYFLNLFNIDYEQFQFSSLAVGLQLLAALVVPLLAALWPVLSGTAITVREAISTYGIGADFGSTFLDRMIEGLGRQFLSSPYAVALGNMFRRKGRLILTQSVLVLAGTMFLAVMSLSTSIDQTVDNIFAKHKYDFIISFVDDERVDRVQAIADLHPSIEKIEVWFSHGASLLKEGQRLREAGLGGQLIGIPNGSDSFRPPLLVAGRWLEPDDGPAVVLRKGTADDNNILLGDTVRLDLGELGDSDWQVIGFYEDVFEGVGETDPIYANLDAVFAATKKQNQGSQVRVFTDYHSEPYVQQVAEDLKNLYEANSVDVSDSLVMLENRRNADNQFAIIISMMLVLAVIMALVGGIGLMGALSISVVERIREIGVMRAVGAKTPTILGMFVMEGVLQGLLSWIIVVPISFVLGRPLANAFGLVLFDATLDYQYNFSAVLIWLGMVLVISILASVLPARSATQISVRDSLAYS
jgi:putative ABC transport system permease protein